MSHNGSQPAVTRDLSQIRFGLWVGAGAGAQRWQTIRPFSHAVRGAAVLPAASDRVVVGGFGTGPVHVQAGAEPLGFPFGSCGRAVRRHVGVDVGVEDPRRTAGREGGDERGRRRVTGRRMEGPHQGQEQPR